MRNNFHRRGMQLFRVKPFQILSYLPQKCKRIAPCLFQHSLHKTGKVDQAWDGFLKTNLNGYSRLCWHKNWFADLNRYVSVRMKAISQSGPLFLYTFIICDLITYKFAIHFHISWSRNIISYSCSFVKIAIRFLLVDSMSIQSYILCCCIIVQLWTA